MEIEKLKINYVNKYKSGWHPDSLYSGFTCRFTIIHDSNIFKMMSRVNHIKKVLNEHYGPESKDWFIVRNLKTDRYELYTTSSSFLTMWLLKSEEEYLSLIESFDKHSE